MKNTFKKFIDNASARLHIDLHYFVKGAAWLTSGQFVLSGLAIVSATAFANLLPQEVFGQYRYILSIVGILGLATLSGMDTALMRAASRGYEKTFYPILKKKILWGLLGSLGALVCSVYYSLHNNPIIAGALALSALFIPLKDPLGLYDSLLQARRVFGSIAVYRIIVQTISVSTLVTTIFFTKNIYLILLSYFIPNIIAELYILRTTLARIPLKGAVDTSVFKYGYHLSFIRTIGGVVGNLQNIVIFHFLGPASVAMYYFATAPTEQVRAVLGNVETLLFPKTAKDSWNIGTFQAFARKTAPFILLLTTGTIAYIVLAPWLFSIAFPAYLGAAFYSQLYAPTIVLTAINTVLYTIMRSKGAVKTQYIVGGIDTVLQFVVTIPMIHFFGIIGLIGAVALTKGIQTLLLTGSLFFYPSSQT